MGEGQEGRRVGEARKRAGQGKTGNGRGKRDGMGEIMK